MAEAETKTKVPLSRFLVWIALVSVIGFFLGQKFSDNEEINRLMVTVATTTTTTVKEEGRDSSPTQTPSKSLQQPPLLLEQYLKEQEEKKEISLPQFFVDSTTTANDDTTQDEEDDSYYQNLAQRKQFAEFLVHPTLLVSGTAVDPEDPSESIAIAVDYNYNSESDDGLQLAQDLLKEIRRHKYIEKITFLFLSKDFTITEDQNTSYDCPPELVAVVLSDDDDDRRRAININCIKVNPSWGYEKVGFIQSHVLPKEGFDVSIVLSGCDDDDDDDDDDNNKEDDLDDHYRGRIWEKELYALTNSIATTCTGRSLRDIGFSEQYHRLGTIHALFIQDDNDDEEKLYPRIVDYDVQGMNIAVAFHRNTDGGLWKWHFNEAQYQYELYSRLGGKDYDGLLYFDGPSMMTLQFPSKHSVESFCELMEDEYGDDAEEVLEEEIMYCDYGYDPYTPNIPIDKIYVAQSTSGENAGRGVFTSVDILEEGVMIGLETNVHSVFYPPISHWLIHSMEDLKLYDSYDDEIDDDEEDVGDSKLLRSSLHRAVPVYGDAYGFWNEPWGSVETVVCSHILTFVNHGCNGTANIGVNYPGINEFTLDPTLNKLENSDDGDADGSGFVIPEEFQQAGVYPYSPHRDRAYLKDQTLLYVVHPPILKGEELFDNYMGFGGDSFFVQQLMELKRDCSGGLGTVEQHQQHHQVKTKHSNIHQRKHHHHNHNHNIDIDINIDGRNVNKEENDDDEEDDDDDYEEGDGEEDNNNDDVVPTTEDDDSIDGSSSSGSSDEL